MTIFREVSPLLRIIVRVALMMLLACGVGVVAAKQIGYLLHSPVAAYVVQGSDFYHRSIYIRDLTRNFTIRVTDGEGANYSPTWSPDGHYLMYRCDVELCVMDWFTGETTRTHFAIGERLLWSPDGTHLLVTPSELPLASAVPAIYVMDISAEGIPDTSTVRYLGEGSSARWSPDGMHIVFASDRDGDMEIYVSDWDGENRRNLTQNTLPDFSPAWSPDGQYIAFTSNRDAYNFEREVYVMDLNGNLRSDINFRYNAYSPVWLPDGSGIAFLSITATACVHIIVSGEETCFSGSTANHMELAVSPEGRYFTTTVLRSESYYTLLIDSDNFRIGYHRQLGSRGIPAWMP